MRKPDFAYAKTKAQISCAVTAQLISDFAFATRIANFKVLAFLCDCTDRFMLDLVVKPEDHFSRVTAQI